MSEVMLRRMDEIQTVNGPIRKVMWDACRDCDEENCPISHECPYSGESEKCHVMRLYLDEMFLSALNVCGKEINSKEMIRIGVHLMPLYSTLCWLKIHFKNLDNPFYENNSGIKVHPLLGEIRKTVQSIEQIWSKVGLKDAVTGNGKQSSMEQWLNGESGYYEEMSGE